MRALPASASSWPPHHRWRRRCGDGCPWSNCGRPNAEGRYDSGFHGFGRCATDAQGRFCFATLKPGPVAGPGNGIQAPHVALTIFARGLMRGLVTRAYFAGDARLAEDPILALVPRQRRATLIAQPDGQGAWRLDIRLQGEGETVFLEV